ncbi:hypothetical protein Ancab_007193 [Ancistrocladus abbreviatus]
MMELFVDDEVHLYIHDSDDKSKPLIDEDLCDDAQAFFDEVDSIIYRSQHGSSSRLRIDDRAFDIGLDANLSDGLSAQANNLGEGGCTDDVLTNDDWQSNEGEEVDNDESEIDDLGHLTYPIEDNTDDSDGYEPNLKDKWHIDEVDNEHDFEVPAYLKGKFFEYNKDGSVSLEVGLMFYDKGQFLEALTDYAVFNGFDMLRFKHSRQRFRACCSNDSECPWMIHASVLPDKPYNFYDGTRDLVISCIALGIQLISSQAVDGPPCKGKRMGGNSPCASCKLLRRRCATDCIFAPYFPPDDPLRFAIVHKVFGASNVSKMLQELPVHQRADAVSSLVFEANARMKDPVYGCAGAISYLQNQVSELQMQLAAAQAEILCIQMQQEPASVVLPSQIELPDEKSLLFSTTTSSIDFNNLQQYLNFTSSENVIIQDPLKRESLWA